MQHCVRRCDARRAASAKLSARVALIAAQAAWGGSEASGALRTFFQEMDDHIEKSFASVALDPEGYAAQRMAEDDLAAFDAIAAKARPTP